MLNALRDKTQGLIGAVLLVVLVVPFALWGVSSYFSGSSTTYVARGHGLRITRARFEQDLAEQRAAMTATFGKELNPAVLTSQRFKKAVLTGLVNKTLLLRDASRAGYTVSPVALAEEIRQVPAFRVNGVFNEARYRQLLQAEGMTPAHFEQRVRDLTILNEVKVGLLASAFVPQTTAQRAIALLAQHRAVAYAVASPDAYTSHVVVSPAQIQQFYAGHPADFRLPEQVRIDYVLLSPQAIARHMNGKAIATSTLKRAYARHASLFVRPQERLAAHILIALPSHPTAAQVTAAEAKLESVRARILHGASFAAMARQYSQDTSTAAQGGRLGYVTRADLSKPVAKALFALPVGGISPPVEGQSGVHLLKVLAIRPAVRTSFAQARAQLVRMVVRQRANRRLYRLSERLRNKAFEHPHSLMPAAKAVGLSVHHSGWFTRAGGAGVAALPKVVKAVFAPKVLAGQRNTHAIAVGENAILIAHVVGRKPARTQPLAAVRAQVLRKVRAEQARERAKAAAEALVQAVAHGKSFTQAAQKLGLRVVTPAPLSVKSTRVPPALRESIFSAPVSAKPVAGTVSLAHGQVAVFVVRRVVLGNPAAHPQLVAKTTNLLNNASGIDAYLAYVKTLRARARIHLNLGQL
ncbi:MAG: SurA N-terminal domain-containing protein [Gammaproteobacteria bacterium]|nr:SurA N-terminal domain-containing protein [Gammaproteobacteria bacterium]